MKKFVWIVILIGLGLITWHFLPGLTNYASNFSGRVKEFASSTVSGGLENISQTIFTPPPLRSGSNESNSFLTRAGIITQTNIQRKQNGQLPALKENFKLDAAAMAKVNDMFKQQYFEHENPQGKGPADLAKAQGYEYVVIGENLALGNFKDDRALVEAWMNSPGHRANILNDKYEEMGAAVGLGMFEGKKVWLAVQEFGKPKSSCPSVNMNLKTEITSLESEVNQEITEINSLKAQMEAMQPKTQQDYDVYNQKVHDYNDLIKIYNNKIDVLKQITDDYNNQVKIFNSCLDS